MNQVYKPNPYRFAEIGEQIEERINSRLSEEGISLDQLALKLTDKIGYKPHGQRSDRAKRFIEYVMEGCLCGTPSTNPKYPERSLDKLSMLLFSLGYDPKDRVIREIKENLGNFEYPPKEFSRVFN